MNQLEEWCRKLRALAMRVRSRYAGVMAALKDAADEKLRGRENQSKILCGVLDRLQPIHTLWVTAYEALAELAAWLTEYEPLVDQHGQGLQGQVFRNAVKSLHSELSGIGQAPMPAAA